MSGHPPVTAYAVTALPSPLAFLVQSNCLALWFNAASDGPRQIMAFTFSTTFSAVQYVLIFDGQGNGTGDLIMEDDNNQGNNFPLDGGIPTNTWHSIVIKVTPEGGDPTDLTDIKSFDGEPDNFTPSGNLNFTDAVTINRVVFGTPSADAYPTALYGDQGGNPFIGRIDSTGMWSPSFDSDDNTNWWNAGAGITFENMKP